MKLVCPAERCLLPTTALACPAPGRDVCAELTDMVGSAKGSWS